ncbi:MAG: TVP38/TMEM64 family protein [Silvanigrellales bacterium]|jgi:uncharacterized membrane protein YdjX (TVP38/TMEM64 family)|nr:TVP38/TMEM64 family protein [Silvanigrellales bacterium]
MIFGIDILPWFESFIANTRAAPFAGLLFVVLYAAITCIPLPGTRLVAIGAGALFGPLQAFGFVYVGALLGATGGFFASRFFFGRRLEPLIVKRFPKLFAETEINAEVYLWSLRLSPLFSFALVHYAMGLTRVRFTRFLGVTALCSAAYSVLYVTAGGALAQAAEAAKEEGPEKTTLPFAWLAAFFLLSLLPLAFRKRG